MTEHKHQEVYSKSWMNKLGISAKLDRCAYAVSRRYGASQCQKKLGHGPNGIYCAVHAAEFEKHANEAPK